jgi:hypothetical protein
MCRDGVCACGVYDESRLVAGRILAGLFECWEGLLPQRVLARVGQLLLDVSD